MRSDTVTLRTLNLDKLRAAVPLDIGQHDQPTTLQPLGLLQRLPNEIFCHVLASVDIPTLMSVLRISHAALSLVNSLPELVLLANRHGDVLRAVVASEAQA
ncbi:hypothetical protein B0H67DRAFT_647977 [Lasiosphaeris hirsuta]|uniref:F-box domain-containing protein n=1 Tax=Lasiosphaeris hirsuta TaxID=260670 RepID=A0AA40DL98_9PEZI|nr:hypothetical protein B0H67DRAFT_647977 [Lasiosphaeris hirsuta]